MKKGQLEIWERSIDLYGEAVGALARENAALRAERDKLREKGQLVCRAYLGIRAERDRLRGQNKQLRETNIALQAENAELGEALDWLNGQVAALRRGEE